MHLTQVFSRELFEHGRVYFCGVYYPLQHKNHWRSPMSRAVWSCKHGNASALRECGGILAQLLEQAISAEMLAVLTFVPDEPDIKHGRRCDRSVAEHLAQEAYRRLSAPCQISMERLLEPIRPKAKKQHRCQAEWERRGNVVGCYAVPCPDRVIGKTVFVVDDVLTSGATLRECERVLLQAGAQDVRGLVLAKTVGW